MCYDRLVNDETVAETGVTALFRSELSCALRNGALAGVMVLAVLLFEGAPLWVTAASVVGAVALGTLFHQCILLAGAGVLRVRARWRESGTRSAG